MDWTGRIGKANPSLRGASKREQTREELLKQAEQQRQARKADRQRGKSAVVIQAAWRGHASRQAASKAALLAWQQQYAAAAASPALQLSGEDILQGLVPLLFAVVLPPAAGSTQRALCTGGALHLNPTTVADTGAAAAAATPRPACEPHAVLRGSLLLVMRSITAPTAQHNYCTAACSTDASVRTAWQRQAARLCQMCCLLLGTSSSNGKDTATSSSSSRSAGTRSGAPQPPAAPAAADGAAGGAAPQPPAAAAKAPAVGATGTGSQQDALLQAAAARLLHLLTTPSSWKAAVVAEDAGRAAQAAAGVLLRLQQQPLPLFKAAQRLLVLHQQQQKQQQEIVGTGASGQLGREAAAASGVLGVCIKVLYTQSPDNQQHVMQQQGHMTEGLEGTSSAVNTSSSSRSGGGSSSSSSDCLRQFVQEVLTLPGAVTLLAPGDQAALQDPVHLQPLLEAAAAAAASRHLAGAPALHCYSNLVQLVAPLLQSAAHAVTPAGASAAGGSSSMAAAVAGSYCAASLELLSAAAQGPSRSAGGVAFDRSCQQQLQVKLQAVCSRRALLRLLELLDAGQKQQQQQHQSATTGGTTGRHPAVAGDGGMVVFAAWCLHVLEDLPAALALHSSTGQPVRSSVGKDTPGGPQHHPSAATHSESAAGSDDSDTTASQGSSALINTLAFAPDLLLKLWRWLAVVVGLPLEAPLEASRGLDVAAVAGGARGLPAQHALVLGVFCRAYCQLLLVLSDDDIHHQQAPFTTGATRAIATTLNSLVVHSFLPKAGAGGLGQPRVGSAAAQGSSGAWVTPATLAKGQALLERYAPQALRGLYDADTRQPFCQAALWTASFLSWHAHQRQQQQQMAQKVSPSHHPSSAVAGPGNNVGTQPAAVPLQQQVLLPWQRLLRRHQQLMQQRQQQADASGPVLPWSNGIEAGEDGASGSSSRSSSRGGGATGMLRAIRSSIAGRRDSEQQALAAAGGNEAWGPPPLPAAGAAAATTPEGATIPFVAAVVQALLPGLGQEEDEEGGGASAAAAAAAAAGYGGVRPSALVALLKMAPQAVPFELRLDVFQQMLQAVKAAGRWDLLPMEGGPRPLHMTVRRDHLLEDAWSALRDRGPALKGRLVVTFVDAHGMTEAGMDGGGLQKELLELVVANGCQADYGLFTACEGSGALYPSPTAERLPQGLALLEFIGNIVGKALFEGILLNLALAPFFTRGALQGRRLTLDDLASLDPQLYRSAVAVKTATEVEALGLTFATEQQLFGQTISYELLPGQGDTPVTPDNQLLYVTLLANWHLSSALGPAAAAFRRGLGALIPLSWFNLFNAGELNQLLSGGADGGIDVADMRRYTQYVHGYHADAQTIKHFWSVVEDMDPAQRAALLRFMTSTSRAPLGGFQHLNPPLTVQKVDCDASPLALVGGKDVERLPTASTCYNMLKLPNYRRKETLREKLLYAIQSGAGFDLS